MSGILFLGFLIGMRHALEADHVAAVAVLATRAKTVRQAVPLGIMWGMGHTLTLFAFGAVIVLLNSHIPPNVSVVLEGLVGVMLVGLGLDVIYRLVKKRVHFHIHSHAGDKSHIHAHSHEGETVHDEKAHAHDHVPGMSGRALLVGMMHGLAGSAALVLLTMQSVEPIASRIFFILLFGLGSVAGMGALSFAIAIPMRYAAKSMTLAYSGLSAVLGMFSIGLGSLTIYHTVSAL